MPIYFIYLLFEYDLRFIIPHHRSLLLNAYLRYYIKTK